MILVIFAGCDWPGSLRFLFPGWLPLQFRMIYHNMPCLFASITHRWVYCPSWAGGRCNLRPPCPSSPPPPDGKQAASRSDGLEVANSQQETRIQTKPIIVPVRSNSRRLLILCPVRVRVCLLCIESDVIRGRERAKSQLQHKKYLLQMVHCSHRLLFPEPQLQTQRPKNLSLSLPPLCLLLSLSPGGQQRGPSLPPVQYQ